MPSKFSALLEQLDTIQSLAGISSVLSWDQETYMPDGAIDARAKQSALMATLVHERWTSRAFRDTLAQFVDLSTGDVDDSLSFEQRRLIEEAYRDWRQANGLPQAFVESLSKLLSESQHVWQNAKKTHDFASFAPYLKDIIDKSKQKAGFLGEFETPYDALLDEFEPGMTSAKLTPLFATLRDRSVALLQKIQAKPAPKSVLVGPFDTDAQWNLGMDMLALMGFDFNCGRQDLSTHPFTTEFDRTDVRVTTRVHPDKLMDGFSSTIHEGGHALYEQGLDPEWAGTPLGASCSLGIHESQSRLWEKLVGMSRPFWQAMYPRFQERFPDQLGGVSLDEFYADINRVAPSLIRVEADELTYNLHILIRFELEMMMINSEVDVMDLPELWADKYEAYLGIRPETVADGILQDVHWSAGLIGYFPTYTLGNLYSVQIFEAAKQAIPGLVDQIGALQFSQLKTWLNTAIHRPGRLYGADDLVTRVTGAGLQVDPFMTYLENKYS